jgi:aryl-alcohol dehydrogenase-like predicted oxidoreductase
MPTRRRLLTSSAGLGLMAVMRPLSGLAQAALLERAVPATGERLPVIGLGTYRTFDVGASPEERAPLIAVTRAFFEHGGVVVDSSPRYGPSESVFGDVLVEVGRPERIFAATKIDADDRETGLAQMHASSDLMGVERVDLSQVHNLRAWRTQLPMLREMKRQGRIRYVGISASRDSLYAEFESIMRSEPLDFIQINYSVGERGAAQRILPLAQELGIAVLINRPFAAGELFSALASQPLPTWAREIGCRSWAQLLLKYVLAHPAVTVVLQATADPEHLLDNLAAARGELPDAALRGRLEALLDAA